MTLLKLLMLHLPGKKCGDLCRCLLKLIRLGRTARSAKTQIKAIINQKVVMSTTRSERATSTGAMRSRESFPIPFRSLLSMIIANSSWYTVMLKVALVKTGPLGPFLATKSGPPGPLLAAKKWTPSVKRGPPPPPPPPIHFWQPKVDLVGHATFGCQKWTGGGGGGSLGCQNLWVIRN